MAQKEDHAGLGVGACIAILFFWVLLPIYVGIVFYLTGLALFKYLANFTKKSCVIFMGLAFIGLLVAQAIGAMYQTIPQSWDRFIEAAKAENLFDWSLYGWAIIIAAFVATLFAQHETAALAFATDSSDPRVTPKTPPRDDAEFAYDPSAFEGAGDGASDDEKLWSRARDPRTSEPERQNAMRLLEKRATPKQITHKR